MVELPDMSTLPLSSAPTNDPSNASEEDYYDPSTLPSTINRLAAQHTNEGYLDGITESKTLHVQAGFDEGYILGASLGIKVGDILGVLDGMVGLLNGILARSSTSSPLSSQSSTSSVVSSVADKDGNGNEIGGIRKYLLSAKQLRQTARRELALENVFGKSYFGENGIWKWNIGDHEHQQISEGEDEEDGESTFDDIVAHHPLVKKWTGIVEEFGADIGISVSSKRP